MDTTGREAAYRTATDEVFLFFVQITSPGLEEAVNFVGARKNITVLGIEYLAYPFSLDLPSDDGETISSVTLTIGNVTRKLTESLRSISDDIYIKYWVALASSPEVVQEGPFSMGLTSIKMNALTIEGTLTTEPIMSQSVCDFNMNPVNFPGLFKGITSNV